MSEAMEVEDRREWEAYRLANPETPIDSCWAQFTEGARAPTPTITDEQVERALFVFEGMMPSEITIRGSVGRKAMRAALEAALSGE